MTTYLENHELKDLYNKYEYFIIDLWGVIHDGSNLYPGVRNSLNHIKSTGKTIIFLSNAPRRAVKAKEVLDNLGIERDLYKNLITSGEALYQCLATHGGNLPFTIGDTYYYIGPKKDQDLLAGLGYQEVENASEASFIMVTGFKSFTSTLDEITPKIKEGIKYNLPMICANPDLVVVKQDGRRQLCAGVAASEYQKLGGIVEFFGKPHLNVYNIVSDAFSNLIQPQTLDKTKILAIGDGINTDILGANNFGVDSLLITSGILANSTQNIDDIFTEYEAQPTFVSSNFGIIKDQ